MNTKIGGLFCHNPKIVIFVLMGNALIIQTTEQHEHFKNIVSSKT